MTLFWNFTEFSATLIENWIIFDFYRRFHAAKYSYYKDIALFILFILITTILSIFLNTFSPYGGIATLVCLGIIILYGEIALKGTFFSKCFIPVISFGMIFIINIFINIISSILLGVPGSTLYILQDGYRFFSLVTTKLLFFIATRLILLIYKKGLNLQKREWITISGILFISLCIGISITEISIKQNAPITLSYLICYIGIFLMNVFIFIMISIISSKNEETNKISLLELQLSQQKKTIEEMDILQKEIRHTNHDNLNHLCCLRELLKDDNDLLEANEYLNVLINKNPELITTHIEVSDEFLKAILTVKFELCKKKNIPISIKADDTLPTCQSIDLCVIMSNLLDNAIEASEQIKDSKIEVILSKQKSYYNIIVKNKIDESILKNNNNLHTTKADRKNHGIGVQSIKEIVKRYNGMMEYYEKDKYFIVSIWLPQ